MRSRADRHAAALALASGLAARLREHAAQARNLGARVAAAELLAHAAALEAAPGRRTAIAEELFAVVARFHGQERRYPIAAIWSAAAEDAAHPMRFRRPPPGPVGMAALGPEKRLEIQAAAAAALSARPKAARLETGRKAARTRAKRGSGRAFTDEDRKRAVGARWPGRRA